MKFFVYSETNAQTIAHSLGKPEYSYYFVLKEFLPALQRLGEVIMVTDPAAELAPLIENAGADNEKCMLLLFAPPHRMPMLDVCPTVPVIAWEFDSIPTEIWYDELQQDWRYGLKHAGRAIALASLTVSAIKSAMGGHFPAAAIPAPVWNKFQKARERLHARDLAMPVAIGVKKGIVVDTLHFDLTPYLLYKTQKIDIPAEFQADELYEERHSKWQAAEHSISLSGVVFTSVFNPYDGRKNWWDMVTAFCLALKGAEDATLILKLSHYRYHAAIEDMLEALAKIPAFKCRVILQQGYLEDEAFQRLVDVTDYVVNASYGEGQCLPLMEFLSCGKPAIAPAHSAMADYIDSSIAFVVDSWLDATAWPHDPRLAYRTCRHQIDWQSLFNAFERAYVTRKSEPELYQKMSLASIERMKAICSEDAVAEKLKAFLMQNEASV